MLSNMGIFPIWGIIFHIKIRNREKEILALNIVDAINKGNSKALLNLQTEDFKLVDSDGGISHGKAAGKAISLNTLNIKFI